MRVQIILFLFLLFAGLSGVTYAQNDIGMQKTEINGQKIYYWPTLNQRKSPLIVLSHGFGGCVTNLSYLAEALVNDGYWVAGVNHADSGCIGKRAKLQRPAVPFIEGKNWSDKTYAERKDDIVKLLDNLAGDKNFLEHVDFGHIGLAGHSLGGYTVMGLAGAWPSWKNDNIKAVLALSPYATPFEQNNTMSGISVPIMYQTGTRDIGIAPGLAKLDGAYNQTPEGKYLVVLDGASHFAWTDHVTAYHPTIIGYSLAFFDYHLKGNASAGHLLAEKLNDVKAIYYENNKGKTDPPKLSELASDKAKGAIREKIKNRIHERLQKQQ